MAARTHALPDIIARATRLPSPPAVAVQLLELTADDHSTVTDLAAVLSRDPVLTSKLLKLSNSSLWRRPREVTTVEQAIMLLGMRTVRLMALSFSLATALPLRGDRESAFDYTAYWRYSVATAVAARALAELLKNPLRDEAFLCGLLARIGQLVMAECIPERYRVVCERAGGGLPSAESERELLGFDHHEVGAALLAAWRVPSLIHETVHQLGDLEARGPGEPGAETRLAQILAMAGHATSVVCDSRKGPALRRLHELALNQFSILDTEIDALLIGLQNGIAETAFLLNVQVNDAEAPEVLLEHARLQMAALSVETALDLEQTRHRVEELENERKTLEHTATTDTLTGLRNRAFLDEALHRAIQAHAVKGVGGLLGLLIVDVDHFKAINDRHGHTAGDEVLRRVAACIAGVTRTTDVVVRYGGEEFVMLLPRTTADGLRQVAERIQKAVERLVVELDSAAVTVTVSVGGAGSAGLTRYTEGLALLNVADQCLYEAKRAGRNRTVCRTVEASAL